MIVSEEVKRICPICNKDFTAEDIGDFLRHISTETNIKNYLDILTEKQSLKIKKAY